MVTLYRAGDLRPHHGRGFACANRSAAEKWAADLRRSSASIQTIEVEEAVAILNLLADEPAYLAHEIVWVIDN